jgi:hypothetical protein
MVKAAAAATIRAKAVSLIIGVFVFRMQTEGSRAVNLYDFKRVFEYGSRAEFFNFRSPYGAFKLIS